MQLGIELRNKGVLKEWSLCYKGEDVDKINVTNCRENLRDCGEVLLMHSEWIERELISQCIAAIAYLKGTLT